MAHAMRSVHEIHRKKGTSMEVIAPGAVFSATDDERRDYLTNGAAVDDTKAVVAPQAKAKSDPDKAIDPSKAEGKKVEINPQNEKPLTEKQRLLKDLQGEGIELPAKQTVAELKKALAAGRRKKKTGL